MSSSKKVLVTGCAGFIGMHLCLRLLQDGHEVFGVDNLNDYYDPTLKAARLRNLFNAGKIGDKFTFYKDDIHNRHFLNALFHEHHFTHVVHLAAEAGVLYSIKNPYAFGDTNLIGTLNVLDQSRLFEVEHFVYASSASVYGNTGETAEVISKEEDDTDKPISLYGATKKANELMAHCYGESFGLKTTGLRFFTVYGPWGRPDMALFLFANAIIKSEPVKVYNYGKAIRDFVYVSDIVESIARVLDLPPKDGHSNVFNIGCGKAVPVIRFVEELEKNLGKNVEKELLPLPKGDIAVSLCDPSKLEAYIGFKPQVDVEEGIQKFVEWFKVYYKI